MKYRLIKLWKEDANGVSVLHWSLKSQDGSKRYVTSSTLRPRFYLPKSATIYDNECITGVEDVPQRHILTGEAMVRVYTRVTSDVGALRKTTYLPSNSLQSIACQADILFPEVALIESGIFCGVEIADDLRNMDTLPFGEFESCDPIDVPIVIIYLDTEEQHPPNVLPDPKKEKDVIEVIAVQVNHKCRQFFLSNGTAPKSDWSVVSVHYTEKELLESFLEYMELLDGDVLTGWNFDFDRDYIYGRCKRYKLGERWLRILNRINVFDMLEPYKKLYKAPSNHFKDIVVHENIVEDVEEESHNVSWWREGKSDLLCRYNANDVIWLEELELRKGIIKYHWNVKELVGLPELFPTIYRMSIVDIVTLRTAKPDYILPSKPEYSLEGVE